MDQHADMDQLVGFMRGGRITCILLCGLMRAGKLPNHVGVSDRQPDIWSYFESELAKVGPQIEPEAIVSIFPV